MPSTYIPYTSAVGSLAGATLGGAAGIAALTGATTAAGRGGAAAVLGTTGAATLGITVAAAAIDTVLMQIFKGADPLQVPAAKLEQIFEAASNNLYYLAKAHIISKQEALAGIASFISAGTQFEQQMAQQTGHARPFGNAITNMTSVMNAEAGAIRELPDYPDPTGPINFAEAKKFYFTAEARATGQVGPGRWYADSIEKADLVTLEYLKSIDRTVLNTISKAVESVGATLESAFTQLTGGTAGESIKKAIGASPGTLITWTVIALAGLWIFRR